MFLFTAGAPDRRQLAYKQLTTKISSGDRILLEAAWILESLACDVASGVVCLDSTEAVLSRKQSRESTRFET